ncbi:hypothetical protein QT711_08280 [Sporosarcina saromensis]|uniref:Uncharacterized protein n=1 Tax=Sporosarcina saromensis TaxID=359365 RepID=A0ABU4GC66_9BACL|nr:hypothetical protein [Sporosarcina saromensis]MDW0113182.1 hypothetical protein [Sporosarcina saromensis]
MQFYQKPRIAFLINDLTAVDEHDQERIYFFEKGYVKVLGEFENEKYSGGKAYIIFNDEDVLSVATNVLRFTDKEVH